MAKASKVDGNGGTASKRAVFVTSEKGGVGKSVTARALIDQLRTEGVRVAAYDADGSVGGLVRVLGIRDAHGNLVRDQDPVTGVDYYNVGLPRFCGRFRGLG
ncbi:nucleotide-binding protein [Methylobacterium symbioticum]|nr:P-loop NTPase [Methylobacterium symbioticum]